MLPCAKHTRSCRPPGATPASLVDDDMLPAHQRQQVIPVAHRRTARRVWRTVVLATHTPLIRVRLAPHAAATFVTISFGWRLIGAGVMACADTANDRANPATAINLIILLLPWRPIQFQAFAAGIDRLSCSKQANFVALIARRLEIDQGRAPARHDADGTSRSRGARGRSFERHLGRDS